MPDGEPPGTDHAVEGIRFRDRAIYLPSADALVCADLHLGRDRTSAVELSLGERADLAGRLVALVGRYRPREIVFAGDVLHAFGSIPQGIAETFETLVTDVSDTGADLTVVEGNHDSMLTELTDPVGTHRLRDGTVVGHGHELPAAAAERYVIGHDHPAIDIEGVRRPCYLVGEAVHGGGDVVVLPAFNRLAAGTAVNRVRSGDLQSPLLQHPGRFRPVVRDEAADDTLVFPPLSALREFL